VLGKNKWNNETEFMSLVNTTRFKNETNYKRINQYSHFELRLHYSNFMLSTNNNVIYKVKLKPGTYKTKNDLQNVLQVVVSK
jgi:hypothetical protein